MEPLVFGFDWDSGRSIILNMFALGVTILSEHGVFDLFSAVMK